MSQGNQGKTMIGTVAPVIPRATPLSRPPSTPPSTPPSVPPNASAQPSTPPVPPAPMSSAQHPAVITTSSDAPTITPVQPSISAATVGMRPATASHPPPAGSSQPPPAGSSQPPPATASHPPAARSQPPIPAGSQPPATAGAPTGPGAPLVDDPDIFVGQELCGYTIKRKLAEGGMGVVYEGEHGKIGRRGAIKVLKIEFCRSEEVIERFQQEARAVNKIRHENIVDIYDFGRDPYGRVFFVMEYLEGEPLSSRIRRGALTWPEAFPILEQTLRALKAAHDKGFVHRDLKPDNIWLKYVEGRVQVKLLDFGIAKLVGSESPKEKLTQTGSVIGTPHYMSPEQINGSRDIDHRTDIYAMGVITYEMFAGVTPFVGDTLQAIMTGHLFKEPPRLADIPANLGVPPPIAEIVDRMLFKDAAGRYESVTDVLSDLYDVNASRWPEKAETLSRIRPRPATSASLAPVQPAQAAAPAPQRRGMGKRAAVVGGLLAAGLAVGGVALWKRQQGADGALVQKTPPPASTQQTTPAKPPAPAPRILDYPTLRKEAQTTLRNSLEHTEPAVRVQGSDALGKIKDQPSIPALTRLTEKDPDAEVRGHTGEALGTIGARDAAPLLAKLEAAAPPPLKVWYASALARLGNEASKDARKRLLDYARSDDLAVALKAGLALAEVSQPGDRKTIDALKRLVRHEARLNELVPYAGALILTKMAALRDAGARKLLYALLDDKHEGVQLAAAEGLARLGDDAGKKVLQQVLANADSPNQLVAAKAQIPLGEYGGLPLLTTKLGDNDPEVRQLAASAIGEIGDRSSLPDLLPLTGDKDWRVRIAAAGAVVAIVGIDPQVLAQASVDWTKSALKSQDLAVRKAAAGVLADIPEKEAVPLLAQAILDDDPSVRLAAARSAGKMKSPEAAVKVAAAAKAEADPGVKEQQVKALGEIGSPAVRETLTQISEEPGRIGVIAAGSLIAVGDTSAKAKLDAAVAAPQVDLRLAAVQAAGSAKNPIVVPTLMAGVGDRVFDVRFTAAEGLAGFNVQKALAVPVLMAALDSKNADVLGRAAAALLKLGEKLTQKAQTPEQMIESTDAKLRLAVVPIVREMPPAESVPLLRRLVADPDQDVRRASVEAIEGVAAKDKGQAIKLYKPLVSDDDPVVRSKAAGQLARLVPPPPPPPPLPPQHPTEVTPPSTTPATPATPPADDTKVKAAAAEAAAASAEAKTATEALDGAAADLKTALAEPPKGDAAEAIDHIRGLADRMGESARKLEESAAKAEAAAKAAADDAGASPAPDAAKLVEETKAIAQRAREAATKARGRADDAARQAEKYKVLWSGDPQSYISSADAAIATGDLADARQSLEKAARLIQKTGRKAPGLDYSYAQLYDKMAARAQDPASKLKLLRQAQDAYQRFAKSGVGPRVQLAKARAAELTDDIKELGQP
jgi:HEAT repeat protein/predicted Ser/Thr protein kinase